MDNAKETLDDIINLLNGPTSPTTRIAYDGNVYEQIVLIIDMYNEMKDTLSEIGERVSGY